MTEDRNIARTERDRSLGKLAASLHRGREVREVADESRRLVATNHWTELLIAAMRKNR